MSKQRRKNSLRLAEFDYRQPGNFFVTICTANRSCIFGEINGGEVHLSDLGEIVIAAWISIPSHHPAASIDEIVIMPNHIHGIVVIRSDDDGMPLSELEPISGRSGTGERTSYGPKGGSLGAIVGSFKSASSRNINKHRNAPGAPVWQRNYFEHIIPDERSLDHIRAYIAGNPADWVYDDENPYRIPR